MNHMTVDVDPLSTFSYTQYDYNNYLNENIPFHFMRPQNFAPSLFNPRPEDEKPPETADSDQTTSNDQNESYSALNDIDIKPIFDTRRRRNKCMSVKISEKDFPFYGCSVCNICFKTLSELDIHIATHKDRITSYDLRIKNQIRKRREKKELKRLKKLGKKVKLEFQTDIEIKPEDGYIGSEKASDYVEPNLPECANQIPPLTTEQNPTGTTGLNQSVTTEPNPTVSTGSNPSVIKALNPTASTEPNPAVTTGLNPTVTTEPNSTITAGQPSQTTQHNPLQTTEQNPKSTEQIPAEATEQNPTPSTLQNPTKKTAGKTPESNSKNPTEKKQPDGKSNTEIPMFNSVKEMLQNNPELVNLQKIFKCFACQKQFSLSYYLKLHVRSHTDEKPYQCEACGQSFITASKLGRHNKRFHQRIRHQCRICFRYFPKFDLLIKHFDLKHIDEKIEGEPYDYNAILPYLKEVEEQLLQKTEIKDEKPKSEDLWYDWPLGSGSKDQIDDTAPKITEKVEKLEIKVDIEDNKDFFFGPPLEVSKIEIEVKQESDYMPEADADPEPDNEPDGDPEPDVEPDPEPDDKGSVKDESLSDDDYFPLATWAKTPKIEECPPSPVKGKKAKIDLKCQVCEKKISSASYLRIHMRTHTGEKPFKCYICNRGFITSSKMHRHVLTHSQSLAEDGDEVKKEGDDVEVKVEGDGDGDKSGDGKDEKDKKPNLKKLKMKQLKMKKEKQKGYKKRPHACEFCHKRFLHLETLQVHKKTHEGEALVYTCSYCLQELPDADSRKEHEATHDGPKPYLCTICGKSYKKRETMIYHRKNHKPDKEFVCDICSKSFTAQCKLRRHIVSHRVDKYLLRYECPVCAHMFNTKYHVQMHLVTHQKEGLIMEENRNEILAMVLQNARKIPKQTNGTISLTDQIPSDERSRVCNICGEVFQHFYYLEEHLKSHGSKIAIDNEEEIEEKKHICQVCNKGFKLHYYLKLHSFTHTKEKPYICQQCGKGFITRGKLKRHLETHTGLKKYQCHLCYKFFTRPSYLRLHIRTIHGTQDYNFRMDKNYGFSMSSLSQQSF